MTIGWVGIGLLVAAGLAIVVEMVLAAVWSVSIARRSATLAEHIEAARGIVESDLEKLRLALKETQRLWRPYHTTLRWVGHPLTIALLQSYLRRGRLR